MSEMAPGRAADVMGHETLDIMAQAPNYNAWQIERIAPFLGCRVLEVGAGTGNISRELLRCRPERLILTDMDAAYRTKLRSSFASEPTVAIDTLILPDDDAGSRFAPESLDTVIALNVVEHIEDDSAAVRTMRDLVQPGGHVIILVPAMQALYGEMDRALGHFRRYTRRSMSEVMAGAGLTVVHSEWFNRVGVLGWWFNGRIRRTPLVPAGQLRKFDGLVPLLRLERFVPLPFGQSVIVVGRRT